ncbi:LysR family transcriptional regulator [Frankia sp. CNm7]|uniref:LysR family transcriptional regulator n=1 Tax=Frankia nepalensis TaxID=1836974 RepID=A0A937REN2_9ACTN|nr:LysR family transcriptional regulator [Frankia nepalensis]MBL7496714.1 LysR family transcriptional regulator [Frankia nepalensis]MBL7511056.1 LysR family transcriptional regulator [Frankia nepalensis]MBL7516722.1 LysR family transcriptional regulator [Frankia nepalensis]MBL7627454.1 LysR family transcriptional regulator [Frankia nepalensis]
MDTHRLRYFLLIAEEGSMSRAARVLGIAQPALSRHVRILEEDLGVTLFRRTSKGVRLTEEGEQLRATAAGPLRQLELAMKYAGSPLARLERELRLGVPATAARVLAAPLLGSLASAFPKVNFHVSVADTDQLVERILNGEVDVALINPVPDGRIFYGNLLEEDLVVVGGPRSDLRPNRPIRFAELADLPLVLPGSETGIRTTVENTALRLKIKLSSRYATDSLQVARDLITAGQDYGVLPLSACDDEIQRGGLRYAPLREPTLTQQLGTAVTSQLALPRGFATKLTEIIGDEVARLVKSGAWAARLAPPHPGDE